MPDLQQPWLETYSPDASLLDIFHCFRLILGRNPHAEEWTGHSMLAGTPLAPVVTSYLRSLEFANRGLLAPQAQGEVVGTELPGFQIFSAATDGAVGRHVRDNNYELDVTAVFRRVLRPGMAVLDIGANIGYFTMLSAALVGPGGHVLAIEPNPLNARLLEASRQANGFGHVTVAQVAAAAELGLLVLHTSHSTGTTSALGGSVAAVLAAETVPAIPPDRLVTRPIDLIKIDVDGSEYHALRGCEATIRRDRPLIVSEFAPGLLPGLSGVSGEQYLRWLGGLGYTVSVIEPDGSLAPMGQDWAAVLAMHERRGTDHIDILASPIR